MKSKLIIIFSVLLMLSGCGKKYTITPDSLPIAHINQEYKQIIKISGGKVIDKDRPLKTDIPDNLGITVQPVNDLDGYNLIEIKGIPKHTGTFSIDIWVNFYGGGGAEIKKIYTLKVEE